ncbi:MAG TPA: hypothetical protein VLG25_02970 [Patescibacteria group bacterium]|nr:hypothetical protein [Patescibacteria group bacterium]
MPDDQEPAIESSNPEQSGRRFFRGRRGGGIAVSSVASIENVSSVEEAEFFDDRGDLFGLEKELTEYQDLWSRHSQVTKDFLDRNANSVGNILNDLKGQAVDRDARRQLDKAQDRDLGAFAAIFVSAGRVDAAKVEYFDFSTLLGGIRDAKTTLQRINSKRLGILNSLSQTPSVEFFERELSHLEEESSKSYKSVIKLEQKMTTKINDTVGDNPEEAVRLLDTFTSNVGSESKLEKDLVAFLSNDYVTYGEGSILSRAFDFIEARAREGVFASKYVDLKLSDNDGDNMLAFMAKALEQHEITRGFTGFVADQFTEWPSILKVGYDEFTKEMLNTYAQQIRRGVEQGVKKAWLRPDLGAYEDAIDRTWVKVWGKPPADKNMSKPKSNMPQNRLKVSANDVLETTVVEQEKEPLTIVRLMRSNGGFKTQTGESEEAVLTDLLDRDIQRDATFLKDVGRILDRLKIDPYGKGVHSFQKRRKSVGGAVEVDGKHARLYKASPYLMGLSLGSRASHSRVVFAVVNDQLAILDVVKDHAAYERLIDAVI